MARSPRITIPAYPHHIIQRGNNRGATFFTDDDLPVFLGMPSTGQEQMSVQDICLRLDDQSFPSFGRTG
jgi:putative transposase